MPASAAQRGPRIEIKRPFVENATLPVDTNLSKRFLTVKDLLTDQRWNEAISLLQEIVQTESKSLMRVQEGKVGGVATYVNVASHCNLLLSRASPEGREVYRQKVDPQARRWYENWLRTRDESELLRIVRQAYLSRLGDDALLALGEAAWDRGDFSAARLWWEQLFPFPQDANPDDYPTVLRYPDSDIDLASVLARIVLCSIHERDDGRADDELRQFSDRYPLAEGWLCGKQGRLVETLIQTLLESRRWKRESDAAEVSTFGMSPERFFRIPQSVDVGALRWVRPLPPNVLRQASERLPYLNEPLSYHPVVFDKIVLVNDSSEIRAWNILTGEPAWQSERRDPAVIYPSAPDDQIMSPDKPCIGAPHYTMTIADGRLYARMGSPVTCSSTAELRREFASDLVCLDLTQEGKQVWNFPAHQLLPDDPPWRYEGTPVIVGGRAYVAVCRRHPQLELMVACLAASDGRLLWKRSIGSFRTSVDESHNRVSHLLLTAGGGRLFLSTDAGAIVAMDAIDGRLEWAVSYESRPDDAPPLLSDLSRKGLVPAMFHQGLLFVAPSDATSAFCIEADSGRIQWQHSYLGANPLDRQANRLRQNPWRNLLGVVRGGLSGRLIVSGNSLLAIDVKTGDVVWERGAGVVMRAGDSTYGRGLIADDQIFLPMHDSIEIYRAETGDHLRRVPLKTPDSSQSGGNLTIAGGMLLVAQSNRLAAYCEYSRLKQRIEHELTERPDDFHLWIQLAEVETAEGHLDAAVSGYRRVLEGIVKDNPDYYRVRRKLAKLLQEAGQAEFANQNSVEARDHWLQALEITDDVTKRVDLMFDLAAADEALHDPIEALKRLHQILNNERLASVRRESLTAGHAASESMSRLILLFGREAYSEIESEAERELNQLTKADDRRGLKRLIARYPHASVARKARSLLVQWYRKSGEISEAYFGLCEIERIVSDDRELVETALAKIELMLHAGLTASANRMWRELLARPSSMLVQFEGRQFDLYQLARQQLEQHESNRPTRPSFLQRTWSDEICPDSQVVIPDSEAPAAEFESLLICSKQPRQPDSWIWRCHDWRTGKLRWEETASSPIQTASWTNVHLLIGTQHGWQARSADSGRLVWEQVSLAPSSTLIAVRADHDANQTIWPALFDAHRGLQLLDGNDGQVVANLKPEGRLHSVIGITVGSKNRDDDHKPTSSGLRQSDRPMTVVMQTLKPTRTWCATATSARGKWTMVELAEGGEPWEGAPIQLNGNIIGLSSDHHLIGIETIDSQTEILAAAESNAGNASFVTSQWSYTNFTTGLAPPAAFSSRNQLLVAVDGSRLESFNPITGTRKWSTGLADYPLKSPLRQIGVGDSCVFATSQGTLRSISTIDGSVQWEQYQGDTAPQWRTAVAWTAESDQTNALTSGDSISRTRRKSLIAAWPLGSTGTNRHTIRLCDAETGAILQKLQVDGEPREVVINADGFGVIWTNDRISGVRFAPISTIANSGLKHQTRQP